MKVEVAILGTPSLMVRTVSVDVEHALAYVPVTLFLVLSSRLRPAAEQGVHPGEHVPSTVSLHRGRGGLQGQEAHQHTRQHTRVRYRNVSML